MTIGGPEAQVAQDVDTLRHKCKEIGQLFNDNKCEFISKTAVSTNRAFRNVVRLNLDEAKLLGAPLSISSAMGTPLR